MTKEKEFNRNDLTRGVVWKKLLTFLGPVFLGLLFQQLYNAADAVIVGHFVGDAALAAVGGGAAAITNLILGFFVGLNSGATVMIAQHFGAKDGEGLSRILHTSLVFCLLVGIAITAAGYFLAPWALRLIRNPQDIMADSVTYLRIYFVGSVPLLLGNLFQGTMQAVGDSRRPLFFQVTSCVLNIALDVIFVSVLKLGVAGVGWASVISMTVCALLMYRHLARAEGDHRVDLRKLSLVPRVLRDVLRIGVPAGLEGSMYSISGLIIQSAVNSFGTTVVAAWAATGKLDGFYWVTASAFGVAICAFVGQCYGAGKIKRMKQSIRVCLGMCLSTTVVISTVLMTVARPVYHLFLQDEQVIDTAIQIMTCFVPFYFLWSFIEVLSGTFRGTGDTLRPMVITLVGTCLFRVAWVLLVLPHWHTITAVSVVYAITWVLTGSTFVVYYFRGNWMRGKTESEEEQEEG